MMQFFPLKFIDRLEQSDIVFDLKPPVCVPQGV